MNQEIQFSEPVHTYTAQQLSQMPLSRMQQAMAAQERHATKEQGIGRRASILLDAIRGGAALRVTQKTQDGPRRYWLGSEPVKAALVYQLARRGYLAIPGMVIEQA